MPELPEVESFRRYISNTCLHKTIDGVRVSDDRILGDLQEVELRSALLERRFDKARRHGKYLGLLTGERALVLHFGMSGFPRYYKRGSPHHARLILDFRSGYHLALSCQRLFCRLHLADSLEAFVQAKGLGVDALSGSLGQGKFMEIMSSHRGKLKPALMDQSLVAGIGNIYSDEILFQARLPPTVRLEDLDRDDLKEVYRRMKEVLRTAVDGNARFDELPGDYIVPHRHGDGKCPVCGRPLESVKVSGRTAIYCPRCQGW
ncbi:MAG: Fpg/Nei family DNA glycosylase [Thermoplasmatota archaeon]